MEPNAAPDTSHPPFTADTATPPAPDNKPQPLKPRVVWLVIRTAGLVPSTIAFAVLFLLASLAVTLAEPDIGSFGDAAWLMFQVVTTIGLGDYTCVSGIGRFFAVVLSLYSVFYLAVITGAVVSYCTERMHARRDQSIARFLDQLEHLDELQKSELTELSEKVKRFNRW